MKKKIVTILLTAGILATSVTGCGSVNSETSPTIASTTYESTKEACTADEAVYDYAPTVDNKASKESGAESDNTYESACEEAWYDMDDQINPYNNRYTNEKYEDLIENEYTQVAVNPLSTFAADVDTASYSNLRRMINDGYSLQNIPKDAIRTEELVNYFKYNYKEPSDGEIFGVNAQVGSCPWNKDAKLMTVGINTATLNSKDIPDCNIVFLVDVSGSMSGAKKLPLIQKAMALLVDNFDDDDRISIVTYASGVRTVLDGCRGGNQRKIIKAFESLSAGGSTNGGDGIKMAYEVASKNFIKGGVNRVIICSDGDFNVGLTTKDELEEMITKKKDSGIFLSTLGFGMGNYSDTTMETLADKGNGNYAYIDDLTEAKRVLVDEMSSTFLTVAKDVKLQVEFNPQLVSKYRLVGYENRALNNSDFKDDTKDGGELGAGHQVTVIYEIFTADDNSSEELKYQDTKVSKKGALGDEFATVSIAYKEPSKNESNYLEYPIGVECYAKNPSDDFKLSTAIALSSLAIKDSEYLKSLDQMEALESSLKIINNLKKNYKDEYIDEFTTMLDSLINGSYYMEWYED